MYTRINEANKMTTNEIKEQVKAKLAEAGIKFDAIKLADNKLTVILIDQHPSAKTLALSIVSQFENTCYTARDCGRATIPTLRIIRFYEVDLKFSYEMRQKAFAWLRKNIPEYALFTDNLTDYEGNNVIGRHSYIEVEVYKLLSDKSAFNTESKKFWAEIQ